ncbi:MAG: hypothetical protein L3K19_02680 [Thermoplasmata archaeon]|nr:hypothetical protein [Thermoplasmata archaeon]
MRSLAPFHSLVPGMWAVCVAALLLLGSPLPVERSAAHSSLPVSGAGAYEIQSPRLAPGQSGATLADDASLTTTLSGGGRSVLTDSIDSFSGVAGVRSYRIVLTASVALPAKSVDLTTTPSLEWANPAAIPDGADALPPLADWGWWVGAGPLNDTVNWTSSLSVGTLSRAAPWLNASFTIYGATNPTENVSFSHGGVGAGATTGSGLSLNGAALLPKVGIASPTSTALAAGLRPTMIRAGLVSLGTVIGWSNASSSASYDFSAMDWFLGFARNLSAESYLSVPAGTWGNGNQLPTGIPLDPSLLVNSSGAIGSFPTPAAYSALVGGVAAHVAHANETVSYWNIGNEVPLTNASLLSAYIALFNAAAQAIHTQLPSARVGSDVMTDPSDFAPFASQAKGVGFLAFHYYPAQKVCIANGTVCPPGVGGEDLTDSQIWNASSGFGHLRNIALGVGQRAWHNLTGNWVPVLDAESNLNTAGGGPSTSSNGTDPRQQGLFGAAWTVSMLIDASAANLSRFDYFGFEGPATTPTSVTGPFGGWGFGLVSIGPTGNVTRYAPWWGLEMWGQNVPVGVAPLPITVSDPGLARALAVRNGTGDAAIVVNRADVPVRFQVNDLGIGTVPIQLSILDRNSYLEQPNISTGRVSLLRSSVLTVDIAPAGTVSFLVSGYGVAVILFGALPAHASTPGAPPLLSTSTFFEATIVGAALLIAATVVVYLPRRSSPRPGGNSPREPVGRGPTAPEEPGEDDL